MWSGMRMLVSQAMPLVGGRLDTGRTESEDLTEAVALSLMPDFGSSPPPAPPQDGISFAHMARMGFAATGYLTFFALELGRQDIQFEIQVFLRAQIDTASGCKPARIVFNYASTSLQDDRTCRHSIRRSIVHAKAIAQAWYLPRSDALSVCIFFYSKCFFEAQETSKSSVCCPHLTAHCGSIWQRSWVGVQDPASDNCCFFTGPVLSSTSPAGSSSVWGPLPGNSETPVGQSYPPRTASNWSQALKSSGKDRDRNENSSEGQVQTKGKKGSKKLVLLGMQNRKYWRMRTRKVQ